MFLPQLWCVYDKMLARKPRTNNHLEGWHRWFRTVVSKYDPNIFELIDKLKGEQARTEMTTE